jgi:prepilin-type N-terminal cleavage/methylation domain-containing protein
MKAKAYFRKQSGFSLVEIMIVVGIMSIIVLIAIPSWMKARDVSHYNACLEAQEKTDGAVDRWAIDNGKPSGSPVTLDSLVGHEKYLKETPICPIERRAITPTAVGVPVVCPNNLHTAE